MAESSVEVLLLCINILLKKPGFSIGGVGHQISKIKLELESMRSFLRDAEKCKDGNEGLSCWVAQVRDAALKAEDVLEEFLYHVYSMKHDGFMEFLCHVVIFPEVLWLRHITAIQLKIIRHEIKGIAKRSKRYDLSHIEENPGSHHTLNYAQNIGETSFFVEGVEVVGIDEKSDQLLQWLTEGERQRSVTSIVGMGGSGKTTLAAHAYNSQDVKRSFDCYAWVSVSQNYMIEDLLRKMINEFFNARSDFTSGTLSTTNYKQLVETLVNFLQDKRYIIVLDDVWSSNLWRQVSVSLPDQRNGSRVIITTRKEDIASYPYGAGSYVLHSRPLSRDDVWTLFRKKVFCNEPQNCCPPELEDIARALVDKCDGLPLAVLALGGLMASKDRSEIKWKEVYNSLSWHISNNSMLDEVKTIMLLSFKDLPYFLKNCFLYCCRFPIEHWVGAGRLIRMWMAEGFLEERKGLSPEDVGKIYLRELISRCLLEVEKRSNSFLRPKVCKLHDLMWELARLVSEKERFLSVFDTQDLEDDIRARHLSIHAVDSTLQLGHDMRYVRSFTAFNVKDHTTLSLDNLLLNFRLLRVLELRNAPIDNIPRILGKLFNLRYLDLKGTKISNLPNTIGRLRNLQTLDIRKTEVKELPEGIEELQNLRHLLIYAGSANEGFYYIRGVRVPISLLKLKNLQVVNCLEANSKIVREIGELTQLKRVELTNVKEENGRDLCASIEKLKCLHHLLLMASDENEYLQVERLSSATSVLRKLTLIGRLSNVPRWFGLLRNVIHLHLHWSQLTEDPIPYISNLPVLGHLTLINSYSHDKRQLHFNEGFSRLEDLYLANIPELTQIIICEGVMPNLVRLNIHACAKLKKVPQGIEHLRSLEVLNLKNVSEELIRSIHGEQSVDYSKVMHIPEKNYEKFCQVLTMEQNVPDSQITILDG